MALVNFKKGLRAGLPATYSEGTFYVTTDERAIYLDVSDSARIRLGDFQEFATIEALTANTNPNTTALYYVSDINCLAKWNGSEYVQINRDTGATSIEVVGDGNAVTAAVYSADNRKITLTKGATYMTAADVDGKVSAAKTEVMDYVGAIPSDEAYADITTVIGYVNKKAEETLNAANGGSSESAASVKASLDTEIARAKAAEEANAAAASAAQTKADSAYALAETKTTMAEVEAKDYATKAEAQGYANAKDSAIQAAQAKADEAYTLAGTKATMDEVNAAIAGAGHAVKSEVDQDIADLDAAYKAADSALETKLQGNIDKKVDQTAYDSKVAELAGADTTLQGNIDAEAQARTEADNAQVARIAALEGTITGLSGAMHFKGVKNALPEGDDLSAYADGDVIVVGEKEYVFNGGAFVEFGDVSAEGDRISALETAIGNSESGLVKDIADNKAAIESEAQRAGQAESALSGRLDALELIDHSHENMDVLNGITSDKVNAWDGAQAAAEATASAALASAKSELEGKITAEADRAKGIEGGLETRLAAVEADYLKKSDKDELQGNIDDVDAKFADYTNTTDMNAAIKAVDDKFAGYSTTEQMNAAIKVESDRAVAAEGVLSGRLDTLEAIDHDAYKSADEKVLNDAKAFVTESLQWGSF